MLESQAVEEGADGITVLFPPSVIFLLSFACPSTLFQQELKWTLIASFKV